MRRELDLWDSLSPLLWKDLRAPWADCLVATDASEWGLGAVIAGAPSGLVAQIGRVRDRWRFGDPSAACPRVRAAQAAALAAGGAGPVGAAGLREPDADNEVLLRQIPRLRGDPDPGGQSSVPRPSASFEEAPVEAVCRPWAVCGRRRWAVQRAMPILEGEAVLYGFRHMIRSIMNHKKASCDSLRFVDCVLCSCEGSLKSEGDVACL